LGSRLTAHGAREKIAGKKVGRLECERVSGYEGKKLRRSEVKRQRI